MNPETAGFLIKHPRWGIGRIVRMGDKWCTSCGDLSVAFFDLGATERPPILPILVPFNACDVVPARFDVALQDIGMGEVLATPDPNLLERLRAREIYRPHGRVKDLPSGPSVSATALLKPAPFASKGSGMDWLYFMREPYVHHHTTKGRSKEERFIDRRGVPFFASVGQPTSEDLESRVPYKTIIYPPAVFKKDLKRRERAEVAKQRRCVECGEPFEAKRVDAQLCSAKCRKAHSRKACHT